MMTPSLRGKGFISTTSGRNGAFVELTGALSNPLVSEVLLPRLTELSRVALGRKRPSAARASGCNETPGVGRQAGEPLPSRPGTVLAAVTRLLESARRPMSVAEIHAG